jgi:uncharacterized RDD family membrane protein YckC
MIDTLRTVQTPEGIELHLPVAGLIPRALAWLIDALIRLIIYAGLGGVLLIFGDTGKGLYLLATFIIEWFYPVLFEVLRSGQTPGKRAYGIRVLHDDGTPVSWSASLIRNLLRVVDFLPLLYGFGISSMMLNRDFKRLGDLAAGTIVVYQETPLPVPAATTSKPARPPYPLTLEEQQVIMAFAERSPKLTVERAEELACLTGPLIGNRPNVIETLQGYAKWLSGEQSVASTPEPDNDQAPQTGEAA